MSFFVSDSLKGLVSEEDLQGMSPIKIVEENKNLKITFCCEGIDSFDVELLTASFCETLDEFKISTTKEVLKYVFLADNKKVNYFLKLGDNEYSKNFGTLVLDKLEVNKEDNYIVCKIDIFKRRGF